MRGSKLGKRFTVAGIREYMKQKEKEDWFDYPRQEQDIEHSSQSMKDYSRWEEDEEEVKESASKAKKQVPTQESQPTRKPDISVYEAYDEFQEKHEIPENDDSFFYGAAFDDFNKEWQGLDAGAGSVSNTDLIMSKGAEAYRNLAQKYIVYGDFYYLEAIGKLCKKGIFLW